MNSTDILTFSIIVYIVGVIMAIQVKTNCSKINRVLYVLFWPIPLMRNILKYLKIIK